MPINILHGYKDLSEKLSKNYLINKFINNALSTAITIVLIIMLIIIIVFRHEETEQNIYKLSLRVGVYSLIVVSGLIFLNNYYLKKEIQKSNESEKMNQLFNPISGGEESLEKQGDLIPVKIDIPNYNKNI